MLVEPLAVCSQRRGDKRHADDGDHDTLSLLRSGAAVHRRLPTVKKSPPSCPSRRIHPNCASQPSTRQLSAAGANSPLRSSPNTAGGYVLRYSVSFSSNHCCTSASVRSEERRVGKECRVEWGPYT